MQRNQLTVKNNHLGFSGKGFVEGFYNNANGLLTFTVQAKKTGPQYITVRYAAGFGNANIILGINKESQEFSMPSTGSWGEWRNVSIPVSLKQGTNTISFKMKESTTQCLNIDYLSLGKSAKKSIKPWKPTLLDDFFKPGGWEDIANAKAVGNKLIVTEEGDGMLINGRTGKTNNISTKKHYQDIEFHLEFMLAKGSNAGVYFMGRYEIQILDSYGKDKWGFDVLGGLYQRWPPQRGAGIPAKVNAAKKPGEWQTMDVVFRAPRLMKQAEESLRHSSKKSKSMVSWFKRTFMLLDRLAPLNTMTKLQKDPS